MPQIREWKISARITTMMAIVGALLLAFLSGKSVFASLGEG
jgi:hypothetical protein